jgi:hypothetical protein
MLSGGPSKGGGRQGGRIELKPVIDKLVPELPRNPLEQALYLWTDECGNLASIEIDQVVVMSAPDAFEARSTVTKRVTLDDAFAR